MGVADVADVSDEVEDASRVSVEAGDVSDAVIVAEVSTVDEAAHV